jgi:branched-chain amino acid transport system permease protein
MIYFQVLANGLMLGGLYACIAVGFSLVWGVLNVINLLHGSFIVLGAYVAFFAYALFGLHPFIAAPLAGALLFVLGYGLQGAIINRVVRAPVLMTLTLTFGLDLFLNNAMLVAFKADYRKVVLDPPLGSISLGPVFLPLDRVAVMALALILTLALYQLLRHSRIGRGIVAMRMDREAALLMGVDVMRMNAITFGIGAFMAGAAGSLLSIIYPISPLNSTLFLGKAFVICVLGGLGSIPGVVAGGFALGVVESFGALALGPEHALTAAFVVLIALLAFRPSGLIGRAGFN